jgi:hypothetical protein
MRTDNFRFFNKFLNRDNYNGDIDVSFVLTRMESTGID